MRSFGRAECEAILEEQRNAFLNNPRPSEKERRTDLRKLLKAIKTRRRELERAICADFGSRSKHETTIMEIIPTIQGIDYLDRSLAKLMKPEPRHVDFTMRLGKARIEYIPLGVVGIISPWNYPFSLSIMPLATALAAGNNVMLKQSEFSPATSEVISNMLREIFPQNRVATVDGGVEVGEYFSGLAFDHLFFTGSTSVGKKIMQAASVNLVPVTLELGGKSPAIIGVQFPIENAVKHIAYGKLANCGQTCIAPDYVVLAKEQVKTFVDLYSHEVNRMYPNGIQSKDYDSIISENHANRIQSLLTDAINKGAEVIEIFHHATSGSNRTGRFVSPKIILGVNDSMEIAHEEIFGPILPVFSYDRIDDAISFINRKPRPLALYIFSNSAEEKRRLLHQTSSGNVTVNGTLMHYAQHDLPFGGIGESGMGTYHGPEGFRTFSHPRGIYEQGRFHLGSLLHPPYGSTADRIISWLLR